jgi:hypothetical protein
MPKLLAAVSPLELICIIAFISVPIVLLVVFSIRSERATEAAKRSYRESLERLKRDPHNPDLNAKTLALGRQYAKRVYWRIRPTEVSLLNDINAATVGAGKASNSNSERQPQPVEERLANLDRLLSKELITEHEYHSRRQRILDEL